MSNKRELINVALLGMFLMHGVMSSCIDGSGTINAAQVARMCQNSTVTGTHVYIDATDAGSTTLLSGVACMCIVTSHGIKQMKAQSSFIGTSNSQCGTTMEYIGQGIPGGNLSHSCNYTTFNVTTNTYWLITVGVRKDQPPFSTQYCVSLEWQSCSPGQFQCNNGECIPEASKCNAQPDCTDSSDEDNCGGQGQCSEGQVLCEGGQGCRHPGGRCDNKIDCTDGSDEKDCNSTSGISTTEAPSASNATTPLITVTCTESEYLPQTTTPTTTTPSSTTTATLTTTTAPATTTTSTTATTTPTTTTTAPTTSITSTTTTTTPTTTTTAPTTTTPSKTTTTPPTTTSQTTIVSPTTTFSQTTSSETQPVTPKTTTNSSTTTPIKTTANSVPSASPPTPTPSARSSTTMDISTSTIRTDYSKPAPDPFPPWLIAVIVCICVLVILAVVVAILCQLASKCDNCKPHSETRRQRNYTLNS